LERVGRSVNPLARVALTAAIFLFRDSLTRRFPTAGSTKGPSLTPCDEAKEGMIHRSLANLSAFFGFRDRIKLVKCCSRKQSVASRQSALVSSGVSQLSMIAALPASMVCSVPGGRMLKDAAEAVAAAELSDSAASAMLASWTKALQVISAVAVAVAVAVANPPATVATDAFFAVAVIASRLDMFIPSRCCCCCCCPRRPGRSAFKCVAVAVAVAVAIHCP